MNKEIKWIIQSSGFTSSYILDCVSILNKYEIQWRDFGIVENTLTNFDKILDKHTDVYITRGGTKMLKLLTKINKTNINKIIPNLSKNELIRIDEYIHKLKCSLDYTEKKFDMAYYSKLKLPLLNSDIQVLKIKDMLTYTFEQNMFIKPTKDSKSFNGGIIYTDETLNNYLMRTPHLNINEIQNENMLIAPLKNIKEEYRFFMYKDEILGCSRYILNNKVNPDKYVPDCVKEMAIKFSKLYIPADIYVIDLCTFTNSDEIKIVEYNCWNCSGFYHADIQNILIRITEIKSKL